MKTKIKRFFMIIIGILLILAAVGIIFAIGRNGMSFETAIAIGVWIIAGGFWLSDFRRIGNKAKEAEEDKNNRKHVEKRF